VGCLSIPTDSCGKVQTGIRGKKVALISASATLGSPWWTERRWLQLDRVQNRRKHTTQFPSIADNPPILPQNVIWGLDEGACWGGIVKFASRVIVGIRPTSGRGERCMTPRGCAKVIDTRGTPSGARHSPVDIDGPPVAGYTGVWTGSVAPAACCRRSTSASRAAT
jgi:hypothetical protein